MPIVPGMKWDIHRVVDEESVELVWRLQFKGNPMFGLQHDLESFEDAVSMMLNISDTYLSTVIDMEWFDELEIVEASYYLMFLFAVTGKDEIKHSDGGHFSWDGRQINLTAVD